MITQCSCCQMNSAGMHEWNCPMNPNNINQLPVVISGGYVPQDLVDKIANLQSQVTRLKALCGDGLKIIKDLGNNNIFSHKAVADFEQRLKDEGVVK